MEKLQYLLDKQKSLTKKFSQKRSWYSKASKNAKLLIWVDAIIDECAEMKQGLDWKPWKNNKNSLDIKYLKEETIDILHFLLDIMNELGMDAYEVINQYDAKHQENINRQKDGGKDGRKDYISDPS